MMPFLTRTTLAERCCRTILSPNPMIMTKELLLRPQEVPAGSGETLVVTPEAIGFEYLTLRIRKMARGETLSSSTGDQELALVLLGGSFAVESSAGSWNHLGSRANVF